LSHVPFWAKLGESKKAKALVMQQAVSGL
jgi:hypothetical protein